MDTRGKTLLERVEPILSNMEKFFANNPNFETVYRGSDGKYHPGPAEIMTKALVDGLAPETFLQDVKVMLQHAGNWKVDPDLVMDTVLAEAKEWRKIEAFSQSTTSTPPSRQNRSKSAGSSAKWECYRCGQRGHIARNCVAPSPVASGGEQGNSSAARQQRLPHKGKGNNRGHRGAGRGGSSEGSGFSRSTSAQQQHQASPGSSGSGSGGAAPLWTVQMDASSTTASLPAVPSAAAPGAIPADAQGVT